MLTDGSTDLLLQRCDEDIITTSASSSVGFPAFVGGEIMSSMESSISSVLASRPKSRSEKLFPGICNLKVHTFFRLLRLS